MYHCVNELLLLLLVLLRYSWGIAFPVIVPVIWSLLEAQAQEGGDVRQGSHLSGQDPPPLLRGYSDEARGALNEEGTGVLSNEIQDLINGIQEEKIQSKDV